jgi:hypothetical protein
LRRNFFSHRAKLSPLPSFTDPLHLLDGNSLASLDPFSIYRPEEVATSEDTDGDGAFLNLVLPDYADVFPNARSFRLSNATQNPLVPDVLLMRAENDAAASSSSFREDPLDFLPNANFHAMTDELAALSPLTWQWLTHNASGTAQTGGTTLPGPLPSPPLTDDATAFPFLETVASDPAAAGQLPFAGDWIFQSARREPEADPWLDPQASYQYQDQYSTCCPRCGWSTPTPAPAPTPAYGPFASWTPAGSFL